MSTTLASIAMLAVLLVAAIAVVLAAAQSGRFADAWARWWALTVRIGDALAAQVGAAWAFLLVVLAGAGGTVAVLWPLGAVASRLQPQVDAPGFQWLAQWNAPESGWAAFNQSLTQLGDPIPSLAAVIVGSLLLAATWRTNRWLPPLILATGLTVEWFAQRVIGLVVARGYPPGGNGTWPSGGTARVLVIYGLIVLLATVRWPSIGRRWRVAAWVIVAMLTVGEAYSRLYLLKHWPSDVPAGVLFGLLLFATGAAGLATLIGRPADERDVG